MTQPSSSVGIDRGSFVARVSAALGRREVVAPVSPAPGIDDATVRVTGADQDLAGVFAARAAETGMIVHRVPGGALSDQLNGLISSLGAKRVAVAEGLIGATTALHAAGAELVLCPAAGLQDLYHVDVGVTDVQAAIAETGTLVCWSGTLRGRGLSLVPPIHIAVVRRSDIVPDLIDYLARHAQHKPEDLPSSVVFITGPSKTADIEGVLITGVHGPREVHVLLIDDA